MRKNVGKKKLLLTVLSALTLSLAATIGAFADESDTSKLVSGTKINGVGVGGLTPDEAKARIEGFYAGEYTLNIKEKGGKRREHQRQRYWLPGDCFRQYPGYFGQSECHRPCSRTFR